ncbi:GrpB family protein [Halorussus halophilus]|uniref:GrpB family protein n=1 Tax=Halorussus halophilus TaxID=2650975 RepID=UPI0013014A4A|nr:GrpB family protein [Halorussus halophilus]
MDLTEQITFESDPVWTDRYETERERVLDASGDGLLGIFHVGSTAIPDVPGKPALDIIAVYPDAESMSVAAATLTDDDFELKGDYPDCKVAVDEREDHVVIVKMHTRDDAKVRNQLVFRDFLQDNPDERREYEEVKREALKAHADDQEAYTKAKSDVVGKLLERAREQGYDEELPEFA